MSLFAKAVTQSNMGKSHAERKQPR